MSANFEAIDLGTVAMVKNQHGVWNRCILTFHPSETHDFKYAWRPGCADTYYDSDEFRRLVVIDPEDDEQTSALFHHADNTLGAFRERLRMMAVPVPPEPAGDRAVVADKEGDAWQKRSSDWANTYGGHAAWRELSERYGPLTILREGYTPEAES